MNSKYILVTFIWMVVFTSVMSCSNDELADNTDTIDSTGSITFNLQNNFSMKGTQTRAFSASDEEIDFDNYKVKLYLFKGNTKGSANGTFTYAKAVDVTTGFFTVDGLDKEYYYKCIFAAVKNEFANMLTLQDYKQSGAANTSSTYQNCFLKILDEEGADPEGYGMSIRQGDVSKNDFEIFGKGEIVFVTSDFYTPYEIALTRQVGAVEFQVGAVEAGETVTCQIYSEFYRLYLSQILENTSMNKADDIWTTGLLGDWCTSTKTTYIYKSSTSSSSTDYRFVIYMPYTTARGREETIPTEEKANWLNPTLGASQGGETLAEFGLPYANIQIGTKKYTCESPFPIYRNAKTILTATNDKLTVKVENSENGGVDLDDDNWDGI